MRLALLIAVSLVAATAADAKKRCPKGQRSVNAGTAVYGGPALGFETVFVVPKRACYPVMRTTEDGAFALILIEKEKVGWVSQGLVDARLSESKQAKPTPQDDEKAYLSKDTSVRNTPRFDGRVRAVVKEGSEITVTGRSPDGLWRYVKGTARKEQGWVPRYALTSKPIAKDDSPSAGSGGWSVREVDRTDVTGKKKADDTTPEPEAPPIDIKRGQEASFAVHPVARWEQRYISDAQNDAFFKYDVQSLSGGLGGGYAYRTPELPFVFGGRLDLDVWRFTALAPGAAPQDINVFYVDGMARGGYALLRSDQVDLEAGLGGGISTFLIDELLDPLGQPTRAFTSTLYFDLRPYLSARARIAGGALGWVTAEAALGIGGLYMFNDPANIVLPPDLNLGAEPNPTPAAPNTPPVEGVPELASPVSLALGVDLLVRYSYPISPDMSLDFGGMVRARQANLGGPGLRFEGFYTKATNTDFIAALTTGLTFSGF